jgi:hypothetical protein
MGRHAAGILGVVLRMEFLKIQRDIFQMTTP